MKRNRHLKVMVVYVTSVHHCDYVWENSVNEAAEKSRDVSEGIRSRENWGRAQRRAPLFPIHHRRRTHLIAFIFRYHSEFSDGTGILTVMANSRAKNRV